MTRIIKRGLGRRALHAKSAPQILREYALSKGEAGDLPGDYDDDDRSLSVLSDDGPPSEGDAWRLCSASEEPGRPGEGDAPMECDVERDTLPEVRVPSEYHVLRGHHAPLQHRTTSEHRASWRSSSPRVQALWHLVPLRLPTPHCPHPRFLLSYMTPLGYLPSNLSHPYPGSMTRDSRDSRSFNFTHIHLRRLEQNSIASPWSTIAVILLDSVSTLPIVRIVSDCELTV